MKTIGTCSICGGPVQIPSAWSHATLPPPQKCAKCGAKPREPYGRTIPMEPAEQETLDDKIRRIHERYGSDLDAFFQDAQAEAKRN